MKFGKLLIRRVARLGIPAAHYIDYGGLKKLIKEIEELPMDCGDQKECLISQFFHLAEQDILKVNSYFLLNMR